jgi:Uma2 family endonuclease
MTEWVLTTREAFEAFCAAHEHRERRFELIHGEIVERVVTEEHGVIVLTIGAQITLDLRQNPIGRAGVEISHRREGDDTNLRIPDLSVIINASDKPIVRDGATPYYPDLAVEVKSPHDTYRELREKARFYLANGVWMVWLVYPEKKIVEVYTPTEEWLLTEGDTVSCGAVLPGFTMPVTAAFPV